MIYRLSCAAVVVFWLVMTTMLVMRSYFSSEDRLPLVDDVDQVIELFVENPNASNLNVYSDQDVVSSITVTPMRLSNGDVEVVMTALGKMNFPGFGEQDIGLNGELVLTPAHDVVHLNLNVKFRNPRMTLRLEIDPATFQIKYMVERDGEILVDSGQKDSKAVGRVNFLLRAAGLSPESLRRREQRGESLAGDGAMVARYGKVVIGGERQTAYIVYLSAMRGKPIKLYFSETGDLLKIGSGRNELDDRVWGYEILAEGFRRAGEQSDGGERR